MYLGCQLPGNVLVLPLRLGERELVILELVLQLVVLLLLPAVLVLQRDSLLYCLYHRRDMNVRNITKVVFANFDPLLFSFFLHYPRQIHSERIRQLRGLLPSHPLLPCLRL
jgi:hypothetical protein